MLLMESRWRTLPRASPSREVGATWALRALVAHIGASSGLRAGDYVVGGENVKSFLVGN